MSNPQIDHPFMLRYKQTKLTPPGQTFHPWTVADYPEQTARLGNRDPLKLPHVVGHLRSGLNRLATEKNKLDRRAAGFPEY